MNTSRQARSINRSPTLSLNEKAGQLAASGKDVIHLGIGEPLNDTPPSSIVHAKRSLDTAQIKYAPTAGIKAFKKSIQTYTGEHYGRTPSLNNIIVTCGAKQGLFNALYSLLNPEEEVILIAPYWVSYPEMIKLAYGKPVPVMPQADLVPDLEEVSRAITSRTKAIILNSPNNPSGVVYPPEVVAAFVDFCESEGIYLILDDIYHQLVFDEYNWVPGYVFTSQDINDSQIVVINGISKTYGMTGFRVGWAVGPTDLIRTMTKIQGHTTSGISEVLQQGARGALEEGHDARKELKRFIQHNRTLMLDGLRELRGVKLVEPGGAFYCFPDFSAYRENSRELASFLLENAYLVAVPGESFGMEGHLRLSYTCSPQQITESIQRLRWALDGDAPDTITIGDKEYVCDWDRY